MANAAVGVLLVPVDGSEGAAQALRHGALLAKALNVPLQVLFAFPRNALEMFGAPAEVPTSEQLKYLSEESFRSLRKESADRVFAHARQVLADTGVSGEEVLLEGDPGEAVLAHAQAASDPMIVIGRRGLSRFGELLLGSVSQRLVHHARCPVTVVR